MHMRANSRRPNILFDVPAGLYESLGRLRPEAEPPASAQGKPGAEGQQRAGEEAEQPHDQPSLEPFFSREPASVPRAAKGRKVSSDYFLASRNRYKARISKFVRHAQTTAKSEAATVSDSTPTPRVASANIAKSRFSFKQDAILAVSQVIDVFCEGLFHEAARSASTNPVGLPTLEPQDIQNALTALGWGHVDCLKKDVDSLWLQKGARRRQPAAQTSA
jgi:hypothetical protein